MKLDASTLACLLACAAIFFTFEAVAAAECADKTPGEFPCEMEKLWGKCDADWMKEGDFCGKTCGFCEEDGPAPKKKRRAAKSDEDEEVAAEEESNPSVGDGSIIKVGETSFEVESPKTIEVPGGESFKGFKRECKTVIETLEEVPGASIASKLFSELKDSKQGKGLYKFLDDKDTQFTVFVPLDAALEPFLETLEDADDPTVILNLLANHVIKVVHHTRTLEAKTEIPTLLTSEEITVKSARKGGIVLSSGGDSSAEIVFPNIWACNSIMHFVDNVLQPSKL